MKNSGQFPSSILSIIQVYERMIAETTDFKLRAELRKEEEDYIRKVKSN